MTLWWRHARTPLIAFVLIAGVLATTPIDSAIANALFFDASRMQWLGAGNWWTNEFIHTGGCWAVRGIVAAACVFWAATFKVHGLHVYRRPAAYFVLSVALCIGIIGLLKTFTNVHCPWDLAEFGGAFPYVRLFTAQPMELRPGQCFPAAHASSGYALFALYFALRERNRILARSGLALGVLTGVVFGIAQQSRGAHFLSHDVWSAFLVWMVSLTLYAFTFKGRLWKAASLGKAGHEEIVAAHTVVVDGHAGLEGGAA